MGESVAEATLVSWLKDVGDYVELDEPIVEIATDKVDSEVPSEFEGYLVEKRFGVDDVIQVGEVIAIIDDQAEGSPLENGQKAETKPVSGTPEIAAEERAFSADEQLAQPSGHEILKPVLPVEDPVHATNQELMEAESRAQELEAQARELQQSFRSTPATPQPSGVSGGYTNRFYSPLIRNIAREEGIGQEELDRIPGTGLEGRLTKDDLMAYLDSVKVAPSPQLSGTRGSTDTATEPLTTAPEDGSSPLEEEVEEQVEQVPDTAGPSASDVQAKKADQARRTPATRSGSTLSKLSHGDEIIPLTRMGKLIAQHMRDSVDTSAHVQSFVEADVTRLVQWRKRVKVEFERREGEKLTFTPMFMEAVALALKKYPMLNISLEGDSVIKKKRINLGMAAALPDGNLIVPVIKDADQLNLIGMARQVNDLAHRAKTNQLKPDEIKDGTYTVTNVGSFGSVFGTPIINQPQVGILALGAIRKVPAVIETESGDFVGIRSKMYLSHSYDHRVVNGALGGMFVKAVADYLENWDIERSI